MPRPSVPVRLQAAGEATTGGTFDEAMYHYAISPEAQADQHVEECYQVLGPPLQDHPPQKQHGR